VAQSRHLVRQTAAVRVTFTKTGEHRYGVFVERELSPDVAMDPAPGYHDHLPHDLLHFVAEAEWKLDGAVFGQLAAGGDGGTFAPIDPALVARAMRDRKRAKRAAGKPRGRRSELLADVLEHAWAVRRGIETAPVREERLASARVEPSQLERVLARVDELAEQWHALPVDGSLTLEWPRPEGRPRTRRRAERATTARR
jgi:hypothetical protein